MTPIADINPKTDVDVQDSCNCVSNCCTPRGSIVRRKKKIVEKKTDQVAETVLKTDKIKVGNP